MPARRLRARSHDERLERRELALVEAMPVSDQPMLDRKRREQAFHDARFSAPDARASDRFYSITEGSRAAYHAKLSRVEAGARVLEFGCGVTSSSLALAARGAKVTAIDISPVAVDLARQEATRLGLDATFAIMDAEALEFPERSFDLVCGSGILHHLALERALREVTRVLATGGRAVFTEPLGHNPIVNWYRNRTPEQRTQDEHPLVLADFALAGSFFDDVGVSYHHLATLAALPFCTTVAVGPLSRALDVLDRGLFAVAPAMKRYAWVAIIDLARPRELAL